MRQKCVFFSGYKLNKTSNSRARFITFEAICGGIFLCAKRFLRYYETFLSVCRAASCSVILFVSHLNVNSFFIVSQINKRILWSVISVPEPAFGWESSAKHPKSETIHFPHSLRGEKEFSLFITQRHFN